MRRVFLTAVILATWAFPAAADVLGVRAAALPGGARLAIDMTEAAGYRVFALANPARLVVDLPKRVWGDRAPDAHTLADGAAAGIANLRHGLFRPDIYRLVFDLTDRAAVSSASLEPGESGRGHRLIVDLAYGKAPTTASFGALDPPPDLRPEATPPRSTPPQAAAPPTPPRRPRQHVVVIDPGHGGVDPGAIGAGGVVEKQVNLAVAKAVAAYLEQRPGYKAVLTRDRDLFLRLRDRVRVGRAAKADLFVSIHADSHPDSAVNGASLYTLSETASDAEAARLAQSENRADLIAGVAMQEEPPEVVGILLDLAQRETKNQSSAVADDLLFSLAPTQPLLHTPKRAAGFAVLKAPDVPSVLIELGFISNREDAARLNDPDGRDRIARAIAEGIVRYFEGANTARAQRGE